MPPWAERKPPSVVPTAPVNEPFSWPKSWLSAMEATRPPQFIATNGCVRRGPATWIARATSSFPQPVSPVTSTGHSNLATRSMACSSCRTASDTPASRGHDRRDRADAVMPSGFAVVCDPATDTSIKIASIAIHSLTGVTINAKQCRIF
jgi:hypothetical protein